MKWKTTAKCHGDTKTVRRRQKKYIIYHLVDLVCTCVGTCLCDSINAKRPIAYIFFIPTVPLSVSTTTTTTTTKTTPTTANLVKRKCFGSKDTSIYGFSSHSIAQVSEIFEITKGSSIQNISTTTANMKPFEKQYTVDAYVHMLCAYERKKMGEKKKDLCDVWPKSVFAYVTSMS